MKKTLSLFRPALLFCGILFYHNSFGAETQPPSYVAQAERGMVATVHPMATEAAVEVFRNGGNAIDAAVAAGLTLGVVDGYNSGIGGGCFIVIRSADGRIVAIDGREMAPAAAHAEMYIVDGKGDTSLSQMGALASGVPGALAAYSRAVEDFGKKPLKDLLATGIRIAEEGFPLTASYASRIGTRADQLRLFEGSRDLFFHEDGSPFKEDEIFKQPDLARTYQGVADHGIDYFYRGPVAEKIGAWMKENGGIMTAGDFANYEAPYREPVRSQYRGYEIVGMPPPSSGGVHIAQMLNILENFDLQALQDQPAERIHLVAEAMKLAFADRAYWLGDPDFANVPKGLAGREYAAKLAAKINPKQVITVVEHNTPEDWETNIFNRHTTHFSAADAEGNWVAITATVNTTFGSKVVVPGTGVILNNEMDDFAIQPGVPNAFGLLGTDANKVEAGKRPLSSMSPTLVLRDGEPILSVGAAGGPTIISQTLLAIIGIVDLGMTPGEALAQPRYHNQWYPNTLRIEKRMPEEVMKELEAKGHQLQKVGGLGVSQAVAKQGDQLVGVHDPRVPGKAAGW